jgi:flagellar M-ring protein FliF
MPKFDLERTKSQLQRFLGGFTTGQKVVSVLAAIGLVVVGMLFISSSPKQQYAPLFSNLDPKDASSITTALQSKGVSYKLGNGGGTSLVPQSQVYQTRLDMSAQGLPSGSSDGYSLLDKEGLTTSEFKQNVDYQRALEGELSKTIGALDAVDGATVHLVVPQNDVFASDSQKPSASVLVKTKPNQSLDSGSVQAIVNLVASSVAGMDPNTVTVADTKGTVLAAPGMAGTAAGDVHSGDTAGYEQRVTQSVQDMLNGVYGPGHAIVRVAATLNFDQKATTATAYGNDVAQQITTGTTTTTIAGGPTTTPTTAPALTQNQKTETYTSNGAGTAAGVLGTGTPTVGGGGNTNYSNNQNNTDFGVGKVTAEVRTAPGTVDRMSVAVVVDGNKVQASDLPNVQNLVQAAVGLNPTRGDTINVTRMTFDNTQAKDAAKALSASDAAKKQNALFDMIKALVALLLVGVVLFLAWRAMKKAAKREPIRTPLDLRALEAATPGMGTNRLLHAQQLAQLAQLQGLDDAAAPASLEPAALPEPTELDQVEKDIIGLIDHQPDEAAATLRSWLADRRS